ncbi:hypothetical protein [Nocardia sp. XZ_19_385]|uniref:hypothetical protein n=1 Tax=Nocardia sp. XZ_19_385 TaxID=2769488 RepID=UPI0018903EDB|nr:hypothetical protein [Nocardia sp. XZ_19_385]
MPSNNHEMPLELFRERPELGPKLARDLLGLPVPDELCWRLGPETVTLLGPMELHLDVSLVGEHAERPKYAVIHEVQNTCTRDDRERIAESWPEYVTNLRKRFHCPAVLLAYCPDQETAAKVGRSVDTGHPGFVFTPVTYWPGKLPPVTDPESARRWPELVLLAVPGHVDDTHRRRVLEMVPEAIGAFGEERGFIYYDYVRKRLPEAARLELEEIMALSAETYKWESDFALRHQGIGRAEGKASAVVEVLEDRGIEVDEATRERVLTCSDLSQLSYWLSRALTVSSASELFD